MFCVILRGTKKVVKKKESDANDEKSITEKLTNKIFKEIDNEKESDEEDNNIPIATCDEHNYVIESKGITEKQSATETEKTLLA
jgi:hypothetical protein